MPHSLNAVAVAPASDDLRDVLAVPAKPNLRPAWWRWLIQESGLPARLKNAIKENRLPSNCLELAEGWAELGKAGDSVADFGFHFDQLRLMMWCAQHAQQNPGSFEFPPEEAASREVNEPSSKMATHDTDGNPLPGYVIEHHAKARGWARWLLGIGQSVFEVSVPVASWTQLPEPVGHLHTLNLHILEPGGGQVFPHIEEAFTTNPDKEFTKAMEHAWETALSTPGKQTQRKPCGGCWRFTSGWTRNAPASKAPWSVRQALGKSAGGAAARGWSYALTRQYPDDGVIVMMSVNEQGKFQTVDGVKAKAGAAAKKYPEIDTIVVLRENVLDALQGIKAAGKAGCVCVVDLNQPSVRIHSKEEWEKLRGRPED
jgi:hypothetical protein